MVDQFIPTNPGNEMVGRAGHNITIGVFHRTGNAGNDTALGEANYSHNHLIVASFYKVFDMQGKVVQVTLSKDTEYAVADPIINEESVNYEIAGVNGTPLSVVCIKAIIADVKADPATKHIPHHRLTGPEILAIHNGHPINGVIGGWCTHLDVTKAIQGPGMTHVDYISEAEIAEILKGVYNG